MEIMTFTYSKSSIPLLEQINSDLDCKEKVTARSLDQVDYKLSAYQGLNPKFHLLLKEYSNLQKDLEFLRKT